MSGSRQPSDVEASDSTAARASLASEYAGLTAPGFAIRVHSDGEVAHVVPVGELDLATVEPLRAAFERVVGEFEHIVVDLRELTFIDSTGLRQLVLLDADARRNGWRLSLIQGPRAVRRLFELAGVLELLPFEPAASLAVATSSNGATGHASRMPV